MTTPTPTPPLGDREPVAIFLAGLAGLIDLGIVMATRLGWVDLTAEQGAAIVAFVTGATFIAGGMLRSTVWSPASVAEITQPDTQPDSEV
jgi:hypothetical protein